MEQPLPYALFILFSLDFLFVFTIDFLLSHLIEAVDIFWTQTLEVFQVNINV